MRAPPKGGQAFKHVTKGVTKWREDTPHILEYVSVCLYVYAHWYFLLLYALFGFFSLHLSWTYCIRVCPSVHHNNRQLTGRPFGLKSPVQVCHFIHFFPPTAHNIVGRCMLCSGLRLRGGGGGFLKASILSCKLFSMYRFAPTQDTAIAPIKK